MTNYCYKINSDSWLIMQMVNIWKTYKVIYISLNLYNYAQRKIITFFVYVKKRIQKHINEYKRIDIDFSFKVCQKVSLFGKIINAEWLNSQLPITNAARHSSIYCIYNYKTSVINIRYVIKWLYKLKTTTFHYWRVINNALSIIIIYGYRQLHLFWTKRTHTLFRRSNTPMISLLIDMNLLLISNIELHCIGTTYI